MPLPEQGSQEWAALDNRVHRRVMDTASNVATRRKNLPNQVHVLIHDDQTGERFGSYVGLQYIEKSGLCNITRTSIGRVAPGVPLTRIADTLLRLNPGMPLICDNTIANELAGDSISWVTEDHYRLEGRPGGVLEVYTPYKTIKVPDHQLPPGEASFQRFTE